MWCWSWCPTAVVSSVFGLVLVGGLCPPTLFFLFFFWAQLIPREQFLERNTKRPKKTRRRETTEPDYRRQTLPGRAITKPTQRSKPPNQTRKVKRRREITNRGRRAAARACEGLGESGNNKIHQSAELPIRGGRRIDFHRLATRKQPDAVIRD